MKSPSFSNQITFGNFLKSILVCGFKEENEEGFISEGRGLEGLYWIYQKFCMTLSTFQPSAAQPSIGLGSSHFAEMFSERLFFHLSRSNFFST